MSKTPFKETYNPKTKQRMENTRQFLYQMEAQNNRKDKEKQSDWEKLDNFLEKFHLAGWQIDLIVNNLKKDDKKQVIELLKSWAEITNQDEIFVENFLKN